MPPVFCRGHIQLLYCWGWKVDVVWPSEALDVVWPVHKRQSLGYPRPLAYRRCAASFFDCAALSDFRMSRTVGTDSLHTYRAIDNNFLCLLAVKYSPRRCTSLFLLFIVGTLCINNYDKIKLNGQFLVCASFTCWTNSNLQYTKINY